MCGCRTSLQVATKLCMYICTVYMYIQYMYVCVCVCVCVSASVCIPGQAGAFERQCSGSDGGAQRLCTLQVSGPLLAWHRVMGTANLSHPQTWVDLHPVSCQGI